MSIEATDAVKITAENRRKNPVITALFGAVDDPEETNAVTYITRCNRKDWPGWLDGHDSRWGVYADARRFYESCCDLVATRGERNTTRLTEKES